MTARVAIYEMNPANIEDFGRRISGPFKPKPPVPMDDTTSRDIRVIWDSIHAMAPYWKGNQNAAILGRPLDRKIYWAHFAETSPHATLPVFEPFLSKQDGSGKLALDLGCGNSPAVPQLLSKNWRVIAVDNSKPCLEILQSKNQNAISSGQLTTVESDVTTFEPPAPADLVLAADIFQYLDPAKFKETWEKIHRLYLKEGGYLIGSFFRAPVSEKQTPVANILIESGAWLLPDRRMVRALLTQTGYEVETCQFRHDGKNDPAIAQLIGEDPMCIQFIAKKVSK